MARERKKITNRKKGSPVIRATPVRMVGSGAVMAICVSKIVGDSMVELSGVWVIGAREHCGQVTVIGSLDIFG